MTFAPPHAGRRLPTVLMTIAVIICGYTHASPQVTGYVQRPDRTRLSHVSVRITTVGETTTTDSGEFIIDLPSVFGPGDPIITFCKKLVVMRPYVGSRGRVFLPKDSKESIEVVVSRKGYEDLLTSDQIQRVIQEAIFPLKPDRPSTDSVPDDFLRHTAEEIGASPLLCSRKRLTAGRAKWRASIKSRALVRRWRSGATAEILGERRI